MVDTILELRPVIAVFVSMFAAGAILLIGNKISQNLRESFTMGAAVIKAICVFSMIPDVSDGEEFNITLFPIAGGIDMEFKVDALGMVFACVASGLWIITSIYSIGYMRQHEEKHQTGYYVAFAICLSGAIGICFAANLLTFFIFYEILTIATYPLVVHYRNAAGKTSGRKYLLYTFASAQMFFAGIIFVYVTCGTLEFTPGGFIGNSMTMGMVSLAFFLMVIGGAVKAGLMPVHGWLPSAMVAPTPVSALLHAVAVVKAGAFCIIRIVGYTFGPELCKDSGATDVLAWFAVVTILLASLVAIQKDNLKARLAFSTIGQMSYIILGICILTPEAASGAIFHIVAHAVMKITLFMCAGAIFVTTHKSEISQMRGIGRRMPLTMTAFIIASLGIAGLPFIVGFVSKISIIQGAAAAGQPLFIATLIASALLSLTYLVPVGYIAFAVKDINPDFRDYHMTLEGEANKAMLTPIIITACIAVILGMAPNAGAGLFDLAQNAAESIFGGGGM